MILHPLILVSGSRFYNGRELVETSLARTVEELLPDGFSIIIHGHCPTGVDAMADRWARRQLTGVQHVETFPADWKRFGKAAGPVRNENMVERAWVQQHAGAKVIVLACPLPDSKGTHNLIDLAKAAKLKDIRIINA
jgi:hypothetical protein